MVLIGPSQEQRGFTLIELLVVISIIGLMASVVLVSLNGARKKARDAKRLADIRQFQSALELYYADNNQYPASGGATTPNNIWSNSSDSSWNALQTALSAYVSKLPKDPSENNNPAEWGGSGYHYSYFSYGYGCPQQWYMIVYQLETANGPDPGVTTCDGTFFQYGGSAPTTAVKTVGLRAK
ncbi:MAG TPA: type II secretion system protein [Patescibacteria group bacterium]|nr:type II secretion system protein [Patescibacteria group bacterium]